MDFGSLGGVMSRVLLMPVSGLSVMSCLFVVVCVVVNGRLTVMLRG
jgi:hypothetical protein